MIDKRLSALQPSMRTHAPAPAHVARGAFEPRDLDFPPPYPPEINDSLDGEISPGRPNGLGWRALKGLPP
jgi:hypothetical protein